MKPIVLFLLAATALVYAADTPDLSGHWQLNLPRSEFGKSPKPASMDLTVVRKGDGFHSVQTTADGNTGLASVEGDWLLDGQFHAVPNSKISQMSKWDGQTLYAEKKSDDGQVMETIKLTVSADGKTATEKITSKSASGTATSTLIWQRK